ncbi:Heavy-metal-associated domain [Musa troglodytarum]|uniref:Heavy-metal-associated domain n=1 Tax=Musa troglodytarum TaxID=320322 RepID=A0A9E7G3R6_9LILI|nr:Heavy-metal-associated domain [Musa troglodytarum]
MEGSKQTTLRSAENLSLPSVQMVVMNASVDCNHCRERISKVVSKMNSGLLDYMVDLRNKEVTVTGVVDTRNCKHAKESLLTKIKRSLHAHWPSLD